MLVRKGSLREGIDNNSGRNRKQLQMESKAIPVGIGNHFGCITFGCKKSCLILGRLKSCTIYTLHAFAYKDDCMNGSEKHKLLKGKRENN